MLTRLLEGQTVFCWKRVERPQRYTPFPTNKNERKPFSDVPIGTVATAWVDPEMSEVIVIVMNEALFFGVRLDHTLICPNQLRSFGFIVNDIPKQFDSKSTHSIEVPADNLKLYPWR
jgi:hypothetical protein